MLGLTPVLAASNGSSGSGLAALLPLVLLGVGFYVFFIRPQQRRARAQRDLLQSLEVGDEVLTYGGIYGTIRIIEDDRVMIEVAPNVELTFARSHVVRKLVFDEDEDEEYEGDEEEQKEEEADEPS